MANELHISRNLPITADEWVNIVETTGGVKIDGSDDVATNPLTGKEIRIPGLPETAAVWFSDSEEWIKVFRFRRGRISFKAHDWDNPQSPVRVKTFELPQKLNAEIIGDNGEKY